jgi:Flp pilus assembly protein TadD
VALPGLRRFGRSDFSFRPGEPLQDYLVQVDVEEEGQVFGERFEINHHPYRLRQSLCWIESQGTLSCLTCHDPHRRVPQARRAAHYRDACLTCHQPEDMPAAHADAGDCVSCHMPKRRTQDVVHVTMTDHKIQRRPGGPELLAPLAETDPVLTGIRLLDAEAPRGDLGEIYRAAAVLRMTASAAAVDRLEKLLASVKPSEPEPWLDLAQGQLKLARFADADRTLSSFLDRFPDHPLAAEWLALARAGQGRTDEGIEILRRTLEASGGERAEAEYNLGRLLAFRGLPREAEQHLGRAVTARPNLAPAWYHLGEVAAALGRTDDALAYWRHALEIDPTHTGAYLSLGKALLARGDRAGALRWLRHGARAAAKRDAVAAALGELAGPAGR